MFKEKLPVDTIFCKFICLCVNSKISHLSYGGGNSSTEVLPKNGAEGLAGLDLNSG